MKILIVIDNIHIGGIGTSFIPFVNHLKEYADCDIVAFDESNLENFHNLSEGINVLKSNKLLKLLVVNNEQLKVENRFLYYFKVLLERVSCNFGAKVAHRILFLFVPRLKGYDVAISYRHDEGKNDFYPGCNDYVRFCVAAKKKITYVHTDVLFSGYYPVGEHGENLFDYTVCVSEGARRSFLEKFPEFNNTCIVCENFVDEQRCIEKSNNSVVYPKGEFILFTACRLCQQKALLRSLNAVEKLDSELHWKWYIAGDGPEKEMIKKRIAESENLSKNVILLGALNNPFPYYSNANAFFLPSLYEASPVVYSECTVLGLPIITTKTCSAMDLVQKRGIGIVCENSEEGIFEILNDVINGKVILPSKECIQKNWVNQIPQKQLANMMKLILREE